MSNLLSSLLSSAGTLEAYGRVLETSQNNVSNTVSCRARISPPGSVRRAGR